MNDFWNFKEMANELGGGTKMEAKKGSDASSQTCCTTSFRMLEKHPSEISSPQHHILGASSVHTNSKKCEGAVSREVRKLHPRSKLRKLWHSSTKFPTCLNQKITEMSVVSPWHCYKKLLWTSHACMMQSTPKSEAKHNAHEQWVWSKTEGYGCKKWLTILYEQLSLQFTTLQQRLSIIPINQPSFTLGSHMARFCK